MLLILPSSSLPIILSLSSNQDDSAFDQTSLEPNAACDYIAPNECTGATVTPCCQRPGVAPTPTAAAAAVTAHFLPLLVSALLCLMAGGWLA